MGGNFTFNLVMKKQKRKNIHSTIKNIISIMCITSITLTCLGCGGSKSSSDDSQVVTASKEDSNSETSNDNNEEEKSSNDDTKSTSENSDTPAFINKYLEQQRAQQTPEGADGVKVAYLTFDDGPSTTVTPKILDILKEKGVNATFFVLGKYVDGSEEGKELIKRIHEEGNAIGIHTYNHNYDILYPGRYANADNIMSEINKTQTALQNVLGSDYRTSAVRLPGGHMSWKGLEETDKRFAEQGYYSIDWNELTGDAEGKTKSPDELLNYLKSQHQFEKAVILMHDTYGKENTAKSLSALIDYLKGQGYIFKTIQ